MPFRPCVSGCGRYLAPGDGHDRCLSCLGIEHAEAAFVDESCPHCGGMTVAGLRTRLRFLQRGGVPVPLPRSRVPPGGYRGEATSGSSRAGLTVTVRNSPKTARAPPVTGTSLPMELPRERAGPSHGGGVPLVSFGAPPDDRMSIATLEGESDQSGDDGSVPLPPSGRSAVPDSDPEMVAMLARAAESVGLEWRPPPCPEPSRLDDWFLGVARAGSQGPTPVPFFPEVHDELTGTWMAPFTARNRSSGSSSLATLDGGAARGYTEVPPVERSVAMQLCPRTASTWRGNPLLPSRACRHSSALTGSAYAACGEAASALHAMALLQVHQAKALRDLHQEFSVSFGPPRTSRYERRRLRRGLWAVRCPPWWSRNATSGCVWLTWRRQTRHGSWMPPCPRPACSATRWRTSPSSSPLHRSRLRQSGTSCPGVQLLPPPGRRRQCLGLLVAEGGPLPPPPLPRSRRSSLQPSSAVEPAAGQPPRPSRPPPNQAASVGASGPETDDPGMEMFALREMVNAPLPPPEEGRAENLLFPFLPLASRSVVPKTSAKEQFPLSLGPQRGRGVVNESNLSYTHPPLSPVGSCGRFERAVNRTTHAPSARTQVSASHTPTPLRTGNETLEPGPCVPPRCPTAGTSVGSLVSLVRFWGAWLALPNPSRWLLRTIRLGYAIQFARRPPKYRGIHSTTVRAADAPILRAEIAVLLAKDAIEPVPPADMRSGFYSPYFIVPKKSGGLRPILDLRVLNRALHRLPFKMLTPKRIFGCVRPQDWFAAIDLKDAYFHVSILPRHRPFLRFAFEGRAYQYKVLPFGLSLSPRVFTKVAEAALVPLREQGVRILNYLDDWLILAQSQDQLCEHRDMVLSHLSQLGLQVNWEKSKLSPVQRISFLGMELDSVSQTTRLTQERAQSVLNCLNTFKNRTAAPLKQFQRLLGHMAAAAAVTPLGLLHMRPLQHWLHGRVPRWAWQSGTLRVQVTPACRQTFTPWSDLSFLRAGVPLEQVSRHAVVYTDASAKGWGATFNGHAVSGVWTDPQLHWHINCLELLAVHLALNRLKRRLRGELVLVRTDNTATVAYINRQGGLRSRRMSQLARHLLLWSRKHLRSLRAIHIPGLLNRTADELSRAALPGEWRLHPQTAQLIWRRFGLAQVDLFASLETSHCQLFYSLTDGTLGTDALAHSWPRGLRKYAFPPVSLLAQTLCKVREEEEQILLVAPYWPTRTWFPELMLLVTAPPWQIPLRKDLLTQRRGTLWHPRPDLWKLHVWSLDGTRRF